MKISSISHKKTIPSLVLFGMLVAVAIRLIPLPTWYQHPERVFLDGAPCLTAFDGYEYLRQAEDLAEGCYTTIDPLRGVPDVVARGPFPSVLSLTTALCLRVLPFSPRWIAAVFPVVAGSLFFPVMFLLGRQIGGIRIGLLAGLVAVCSPAFALRSGLGRFDTDCLIPGFMVLTFYLANELYAGRKEKRWSWLFFFALLLNTALFILWWDHVPLFSVAVLVLALAQAHSTSCLKPSERRLVTRWLLACLLIGMLGAFLLIGSEAIVGLVFGFFQLIAQFLGVTTGVNESALANVAELERWTIPELSVRISGSCAFGFSSLAGIGLMIVTIRRYRATLLSLFLLGVISLFGKRFAYFAVPASSLGMAFLLCFLWSRASRFRPMVRGVIFAALSAILFGQLALCTVFLHRNIHWPPIPPKVAEGMQAAQSLTPPDAVIWSWWDNGCPLMYFSQRRTIEDNWYNSRELSQINAIPLSGTNERTAANFIRFYVARGRSGIKRFQDTTGTDHLRLLLQILSTPPSDIMPVLHDHNLSPEAEWCSFLFPSHSEHPPLYVFLDYLYLPTAPVWFSDGAVLLTPSAIPTPLLHYYYDITVTPESISSDDFVADVATGVLRYGEQVRALGRIQIRHEKQVQDIDYHRSGLILEADPIHDWALLCSPEFNATVFNQLFFFARYETPFFKRIWHNPPFGQLWQVTPEVY